MLEAIVESRVADKLQETGARLLELTANGKTPFEAWQAVQANYTNPLALAYGKPALTQARSTTSSP